MNKVDIDKYLEYTDTLGIVPGLDNMRALIELLSDPLKGIKVIHVAGTNGKGSVSNMIAHILCLANIKVGIYNSPALINPWEVVRFGENRQLREITLEEYYSCLEIVIKAAKSLNDKDIYPTRFEVETAAAFIAMEREQCEYAIIETGMGGLLDATNVIENTCVTVITSISMDHMSYLGDTIEKIAKNKCGIFKDDSIAVVSASNIYLKEVIDDMGNRKGIKVIYSDRDYLNVKESRIDKISFDYKDNKECVINTGALCQLDNVMTAIDVIDVINKQYNENLREDIITKGHIKMGLDAFTWKGRFQVICEEPLVIADGAHNPMAAKSLLDSVVNCGLKDRIILFMAVYRDKDYKEILKIMSNASDYIICADVGNSRALPARELANVADSFYKKTEWVKSISDGYAYAVEKARKEGKALLCFGTLAMMKSLQ